jgi:Ca2+-binding EF-hand superfamily protein
MVSNIENFLLLFNPHNKYELSRYWQKLEEKGLDPKRAFYAFDEDCDEVLTVEEIKKGLKYHKVYLLDNEMRELVRAMDDNHDGVVSITEWENIL